MTDPWMDGAGIESAPRHRVRLALVLLVALALPITIVGIGSRNSAEASVEATAPDTATVATDAVITSPPESDPTTTDDKPGFEWSPISYRAVADTTAAPTTAAPTTSAKATTTTAKATTTTAAPTYKAAAAPTATTPPTTAAPTTTSRPVVTSPPSGGGNGSAFLACVRQRESGGNYGIVSANGLYFGAYQFMQQTWNGAAQIAGRPDLVGRAPNTVAPSDQDAVALAYYNAVGPGPWGGYCG